MAAYLASMTKAGAELETEAASGTGFVRSAGPPLGPIAREHRRAPDELALDSEWLLIGLPAVCATEPKKPLTNIGASDGTCPLTGLECTLAACSSERREAVGLTPLGAWGADGAVSRAGRSRSGPPDASAAPKLPTASSVGRHALACVRRGSRCPMSLKSSATSSASRSDPTRAVVSRGLLPCRAAAPVATSAPSTARSSAPWSTPCATSGAGVATDAWVPTT